MSYESVDFKTYIYRVLNQIHPDSGLSGDGLSSINNLIRIVLKKLVSTMNRIMLGSGGKKTLSTREVQTAVKICFPSAFAKGAITEGTKAVTSYTSRDVLQRKKSKDGKTHPLSKSKASNIIFPVTRIENIMMELSISERKSATTAVYLAAVLEYFTGEILELAGNNARDNKKVRITPRHIKLAILNDDELSILLKGVVMSGGVLQNNA